MNSQATLKKLNLDFANKTPAATRRRRMVWTQRARHLSQAAFAAFILGSSVVHALSADDARPAEVIAMVGNMAQRQYAEHAAATRPLVDYYRAKGLLREIQADADLPVVTQRVEAAIRR